MGRDRFGKTSLGFTAATDRSKKLHEELRATFEEHFRPALVNRIEHICLFRPLESNDIVRITKKALDDLLVRLTNAKLSVTLPKKLAETLAKHVKTTHGARDVHRVVEEKLEQHITNAMLGTKRPKTKLSVTITKNGNLTVR